MKAFFIAAFRLLGGRIAERESGRFEVTHVPPAIRERDRQIGTGAPVLRRYERVAFDREPHPRRRPAARRAARPRPPAARRGRRSWWSNATAPCCGRARSSSTATTAARSRGCWSLSRRRSSTATIRHGRSASDSTSSRSRPRRAGRRRRVGAVPGLRGARPTPRSPLLGQVTEQAWLTHGVEERCLRRGPWSTAPPTTCGRSGTESRRWSTRTRGHVRQRLIQEINYWDARHADLLDAESAGRSSEDPSGDGLAPGPRPGAATRTQTGGSGAGRPPGGPAADGRGRRARRPPRAARQAGRGARRGTRDTGCGLRPGHRGGRTAGGGRRDGRRSAGSAGSRRRCRTTTPATTSVPAPRPAAGCSSRSRVGSSGAEDFVVTRNEVLHGKNANGGYRLALVTVHPDGPAEGTMVRYIVDPFAGYEFGDFAATGVAGDWAKEWAQGGDPV